MSRRFPRGLVVGKFCPLHRGHQVLLDAAQEQCDELLVLSYTNPEFAHCGPALRERWLADLYPRCRRLVLDDARLAALCAAHGLPPRTLPTNDAADHEHRDFVAWVCLAFLGGPVAAVFTSEDYGDGLAAVLDDRFRAHAGSTTGVRHVCVDRARATVPASGTRVRSDPCAHRDLLPPSVYADLVPRVAILGGESSGKTTLAQALADHYATTWAPEYGRELWIARGGQLQPADMPRIAACQIERERERGRDARCWLFCDTTALTTAWYSRELFAAVAPELAGHAQRDYDLYLLCAPDIAFEQDGTRQCERFRDRQHAFYLDWRRTCGRPFLLVSGTLTERVAAAASWLERQRPDLLGCREIRG